MMYKSVYILAMFTLQATAASHRFVWEKIKMPTLFSASGCVPRTMELLASAEFFALGADSVHLLFGADVAGSVFSAADAAAGLPPTTFEVVSGAVKENVGLHKT